MQFELQKAISVLEKTPIVIRELLENLSEDWTHQNEGRDTWSPFDITGHLIHGEKTDWIPRLEITLGNTEEKIFAPFDRFAQFEESKGITLNKLLNEFKQVRKENMVRLRAMNISKEDLLLKATHPQLGSVTLKNLLAAWVVHDLAHIAQISRVMAKQYKEEVGPWTEFIGILNQ